MKKLLILLVVLISGSAYAQWDTIHTGSGAVFTGIDFAWRDTGAVVGYDSTNNAPKIYWTMSAGNSWVPASLDNSMPSHPLRAVKYVSATQAYAVGDSGNVLQTTDGGLIWNYTVVTPKNNLYAICMRSANYGWTAGSNGIIYRMTPSSGGMFIAYGQSPTNLNIRSIYFVDDQEGWLTGDGGVIAHSVDSGATWTLQSNPYFGFFNGRSIQFVSGNRGYCVGQYGMLLQTTDGGITWIAMNVPGVTNDLNAVSFVNPLAGVISGGHGLLLRTDNGGGSWNVESISYQTKNYYGATWSGDTTAFACGAFGKVVHTIMDISSVLSTSPEPITMSAYPNPFSANFNLHFDQIAATDITVQISDVSGRIVHLQKETVSNGTNLSIDGSNWAPGIYFVKVVGENVSGIVRVIKY